MSVGAIRERENKRKGEITRWEIEQKGEESKNGK
jgi:hypothetical protein